MAPPGALPAAATSFAFLLLLLLRRRRRRRRLFLRRLLLLRHLLRRRRRRLSALRLVLGAPRGPPAAPGPPLTGPAATSKQRQQRQQQQQQQQQQRRRRRRSRGRVWSRSRSSAFWATVREKALGGREWSERFRLPPATFDHLVARLGGAIGRRDTAMRRAVPAEVRLALTLSRLGAVTEYRALEATFGVSRSSVCKILRDVCGAVVRILGGDAAATGRLLLPMDLLPGDTGAGAGMGAGMGMGMEMAARPTDLLPTDKGTGTETGTGMGTGMATRPMDLLPTDKGTGAETGTGMGTGMATRPMDLLPMETGMGAGKGAGAGMGMASRPTDLLHVDTGTGTGAGTVTRPVDLLHVDTGTETGAGTVTTPVDLLPMDTGMGAGAAEDGADRGGSEPDLHKLRDSGVKSHLEMGGSPEDSGRDLNLPTDSTDSTLKVRIPRDLGVKSHLGVGDEGGFMERSGQELHLPMDLGWESQPAVGGSGILPPNPSLGSPQNPRSAGNSPRRSSRKTSIPPNPGWETPENSGKTRIPPDSRWESQENSRKRPIVPDCSRETTGSAGKRRILVGNSGKTQIALNSIWEPSGNTGKCGMLVEEPGKTAIPEENAGKPLTENSGKPQIAAGNPEIQNSLWEPPGNPGKCGILAGEPGKPLIPMENSGKVPLEKIGKAQIPGGAPEFLRNSNREPPGDLGKAQIPPDPGRESSPAPDPGWEFPPGSPFPLPQLRGVLTRLRVPIRAPPGGPPGLYRDRRGGEGRHVVTLQATVDSRGCLWNVEIQPPGTKFRDSALFQRLRRAGGGAGQGPAVGEGCSGVGEGSPKAGEGSRSAIPPYFLGGSGDPLLPWLLRPFRAGEGRGRGGALGVGEGLFNRGAALAARGARGALRRLRRRWRCLGERNDTELGFLPTLLLACVLLHNLCQRRGDPLPSPSPSPASPGPSPASPSPPGTPPGSTEGEGEEEEEEEGRRVRAAVAAALEG